MATSDETLTELPGTKVIQLKGGPSNKRNVATRFAQGDYFAFFDDDIEATPYSLFYMLETLKKSNVGMVYGKLLNMEFRNRFDEAGSFLTYSGFLWARCASGIEDKGQFDSIEPVLSGKSAACMIHRKVFWDVGGFDVSYEILGEETDLSWRVWLSGYKVLYIPRSITYHAFGTRFKPIEMYTSKRVFFNGCRNYLSMLYTNLGKGNWIIPLIIQLSVWTLAGIGMIVTGKTEAGINIFKGIIYFFKNIRHIWNKRYKVQKQLRKISDKELLPIIKRTPSICYYIERFFSYIQQGKHGGSYKPVKS